MPVIQDQHAFQGTMVFRYGTSPTNIIGSSTSQVTAMSYSLYKAGNWDRPKPLTRPLPPSPYTLSKVAVRTPHVTINGIQPNSGLWTSRIGYMSGGFPNSWYDASLKNILRNEALLDALSALKDQKFNAGVAIAEAGGLATMLEDIGQSVIAVRRDFVNGRYRRAYERFKRNFKYEDWTSFYEKHRSSLNLGKVPPKVPNAWLYYHFGIKPTVMDLQSAQADWIRRNTATDVAPMNWVTLIRGRAKHVRVERSFQDFGIGKADLTFKDRQSFRVLMPVVAKNDFLKRLSQMGATNLPEAVWNRVPFSWVVDYFTSFGDWLSALDAGMGYEFGQLVESYKRKTSCTAGYLRVTTPSAPNGVFRFDIPYSYQAVELERRLPVTFYPPMYRTLPRIKRKGPSAQQISNMLSVLPGLFGGTPSRQGRT